MMTIIHLLDAAVAVSPATTFYHGHMYDIENRRGACMTAYILIGGNQKMCLVFTITICSAMDYAKLQMVAFVYTQSSKYFDKYRPIRSEAYIGTLDACY
jgi:uncharacterized membrane protein